MVLEDEVDIGNLVAFNLRRNGYDVEVEHDGREGLGRMLMLSMHNFGRPFKLTLLMRMSTKLKLTGLLRLSLHTSSLTPSNFSLSK